MKIPLIYGAAMAIAGALVTFALFFAGFHDTSEQMQSTVAKVLGNWTPLVIGIVGLALAMRDKRANTPADSPWGYGSALGVGVLTGLFSALFGAVFTYIYMAFLNPEFPNLIYEMQVATMEAQGVPADQIDAREPMMRRFMTPGMMALFQTLGGLLAAVVVSLIVAIFFRRRPDAVLAAPPPLQ